MKKIFVIILVLISVQFTRAQEYKVAKSTGRLELHLGSVTVEGTTGNEIIFASRENKGETDKRAEGLTAINSLGLSDNTGLGLNVSVKGDIISVYNLKKNHTPDVKILVPKGVIVFFEFSNTIGAGTATFRNMENEIEVSTQYNSVELDNVTGPLTIKTIYGHVEGTLGATQKSPISIVSIYGYVDLAVPTSAKASLRLETNYGEILVDPALKIAFDGRQGEDKVSGKMNDGGTAIDLICNYGKVYLRKK